jgi:hypothetical protein
MTASLSGVHLKLKRAKVHLDALNARLDDADRGRLYGLVCEPDTQPGQYVVKVKKAASDEDWPLLLGDFIHNLRTALDYLVWQLVKANGETPDRSNEFGIFLDPAIFDGTPGDQDFKGVHPEARAVIRSVQPFSPSDKWQTGRLHPLFLLRELEIVDKHRLIHTITLAPEETILTFREPLDDAQVEMFNLSGRVLEDGTEVCRITTDFQPEVEMNSSLSTLIFIEETQLTPRLEWGVLDAMREEVERVVRLLTRFVVWPP